ncbi:hypothetical protein BaRGS_00027234, partial [Batillaria attramentaria]
PFQCQPCNPPLELDLMTCNCRCNPSVRCVNGVVDSNTCQCICNNGFTGSDCS